GYLLLGGNLLEEPHRYAGAWNFGPDAGRPMTVGAVVEALSRAWRTSDDDPELNVSTVAPKMFEQPMLRLDTTKARDELGWRPVLDFGQAIAMTAQWYRDRAQGVDVAALTEQQIVEFEQRGFEAGAAWAGRERACATALS
ncbi:MAG: CDP-glucose 4,6-dehydratase, partial [Acidimicrobiaceae bacterium]|nr:CDP-glucose 4,6-dehydratase [Acidimicrobiaceae bacterium]